MIPLGQAVGSEITRRKKVWIITVVGFLIGMIITVAEPDLQVLANQVPAIENNVIIWSVAVGVGVNVGVGVGVDVAISVGVGVGVGGKVYSQTLASVPAYTVLIQAARLKTSRPASPQGAQAPPVHRSTPLSGVPANVSHAPPTLATRRA